MSLSIKELSEKAGVSKSTVSKVMTGKDQHISAKTREKILRIAQEFHYQANPVAKSLKLKTSETIGLIIPDISNPFFAQISKGVHEIARLYNYGVFICNTDNETDEEIRSIQMLKAHMVSGIVMVVNETEALKKETQQLFIPHVYVDRIPRWSIEQDCGAVYLDIFRAFYDITKRFVEKKCTHIGFIGVGKDNERYNGYRQAIIGSKLKWDDRYCYEGKYDAETGYKGCEALLQTNEIIDGFVCANDLIAIGAMHCLMDKKIKVPQDIKVTGFDDISLAEYTEPALTTYKQNAVDEGRIAATMVFEKILNNKEFERIEVSAELKIRESL